MIPLFQSGSTISEWKTTPLLKFWPNSKTICSFSTIFDHCRLSFHLNYSPSILLRKNTHKRVSCGKFKNINKILKFNSNSSKCQVPLSATMTREIDIKIFYMSFWTENGTQDQIAVAESGIEPQRWVLILLYIKLETMKREFVFSMCLAASGRGSFQNF